MLLAAALTAWGSRAAAVPVRVVLDWPAGRPAPAAMRAHLLALRSAGPADKAAPVEAESGADGVILDLGHGIWQLQASGPGHWSPGAEVAVDRQASVTVRVALWPAATLRGEIVAAGGEGLPRDLAVRLSTKGPGPVPSPSRADLRCPIDRGAWSCPGPAGVFDVQLEATGYVPLYSWDVTLQTGSRHELGRTVLRRGSSVFGRAVQSDGASPEGPCRATVRADVARRGAPQPDAGGSEVERSASVALTPRGYFQVVGVPPGGALLAVECEGASAVRELRLAPHAESRLDPPLRLEELTLDVVVTPAVDPEGGPWQLTVDATTPRLRRIADRSTVSTDGRWSRRGLTTGRYRVALESRDGTQRLQRFVELPAGCGPLSLNLRFLEVAGRVWLGSQPLGARLAFFNEGGGEPVSLASDRDGRFQGRLVGAPEVGEARWTVEVRAAGPPIQRRLEHVSPQSIAGGASAWFELVLPIAVRGTVVSEEDKPQSGAQVTLEDTSRGGRTVVSTDEAGRFELMDLPAGGYAAVAESAEGVSEPTVFDVAEGVESELRLVVRSDRLVLTVVGSEGPVSDAAVQIWVPPGVPRSFRRTDAGGRFETSLPPGTTEVGLTIGAAGHALKLTRLPVSDQEQSVTLGRSGGTLVLDLRRPGGAADGDATPYLVHDGAIEAAGALAEKIDAIEPGVYALCLVGPEEMAALWRGALPSKRCRAGSVEPGGALTLALP
jgi:hypothetical protein